MFNVFGFMLNAGLSAINVAFYVVGTGSPWSLFAAIFCGAMALFSLTLAVSE